MFLARVPCLDAGGSRVSPDPGCVGGMARIPERLASRLGAAQRDALIHNYAVAATLAGKTEQASAAIRCGTPNQPLRAARPDATDAAGKKDLSTVDIRTAAIPGRRSHASL